METLFISLRRKMDSRNAQSSFTCKSAASFVLTFPATAFTSLGMGFSSAGVTRCEKTLYCDLKNNFPLDSNFLPSICVIDTDDSLIIRDTSLQNAKNSLSPPNNVPKSRSKSFQLLSRLSRIVYFGLNIFVVKYFRVSFGWIPFRRVRRSRIKDEEAFSNMFTTHVFGTIRV